jgi:uncharacterized protein YecE (DUF72 family)
VNIRVGTSGFSYDDWKGFFYPSDIKKGDMLAYYARHFNTVEVNSTYYRLPNPAMMFQMLRKVPEEFDFVIKASAEMTHSETFQPEAFDQFREALRPLRDGNALGCVLAQFPWSFRHNPENRDYLKKVRDELAEVPVVVEFRNADWVKEETFELLRSLGLGFCCVDEPRLKGLLPPIAVATGRIGYVRFHGRNAKKWWKHDHAWERYDYLYSAAELEEWVPKVEAVAAQTEKTYVFYNNHYEGKAGQNARQMMDLIEQRLPLGLDEPTVAPPSELAPATAAAE